MSFPPEMGEEICIIYKPHYFLDQIERDAIYVDDVLHFLFLRSRVYCVSQWSVSRGFRTYEPVLLSEFRPPGPDGRVARWPQITATGSKRTSVFKLK